MAALKKFVAMAQADGLSVEQGIAVAIQAMLVSPHFLFHIERDLYPNDPTKVHRITDVELASRLSYFLWNSMPDDQLLSLAEQRQLSAPQVLDAQVKRMLADPKSFALAENFAGQWLEIRNLDSIKPDPQKFPAWTPELRDAMKTETRMFFDSMLRENRPISEFITARYTFLNEPLAKFYGIDGVDRAGFPAGRAHDRRARRHARPRQRARRVELSDAHVRRHPRQVHPAEHPGHAATAAADRRAGARRGGAWAPRRRSASRWRSTGPTRSAPPATRAWIRSASRSRTTTRSASGARRTATSRSMPAASCRTASRSPSPAEMRKILGDMRPDLSRALTEKLLIYSLGRGLERYDQPTVRTITKKLADCGYGFQTLVIEVTRSLPFQSRRAETPVKHASGQ